MSDRSWVLRCQIRRFNNRFFVLNRILLSRQSLIAEYVTARLTSTPPYPVHCLMRLQLWLPSSPFISAFVINSRLLLVYAWLCTLSLHLPFMALILIRFRPTHATHSAYTSLPYELQYHLLSSLLLEQLCYRLPFGPPPANILPNTFP
jgi:hypothetical protein